MNNNDKERLRFLAARQMEIANSAKNLDRVELWKRHHAMKGERPLIHIEIDTFAHEVIEPLLVCEDPMARSIEYQLIKNVINLDLFDDDKVVPPYYQTGFNTGFNLFGRKIETTELKKDDGTTRVIQHQHNITDDRCGLGHKGGFVNVGGFIFK